MKYTRVNRRGALGVHPGVLALGLVLVGLVVWKTVATLSMIDSGHYFNASGLKSKAVTQGVTVVLGCLAIAGGVGAACHFAFGKSLRAANAGMMVVLLLGVGVLGFQMVRYYTRAVPPAAGTPPSATTFALAPVPSATPAPTSGSSVPGPPGASNAAPAGMSSPTMAAPAATPAPVATPAPAPAPVVDPKPIFEPIRVEYAAKCEALAARADAAFGVAARPKKMEKFLEDSIAEFGALKAEAEALESSLRTVSDAGKDAMERAGAGPAEAMRAAMEFDREFKSFERRVACGQVGSFAERAAGLFTVIRENLAKVQIDAKGVATSKDNAVETKLFHARTHVGFAVDGQEKTLGQVRGQ